MYRSSEVKLLAPREGAAVTVLGAEITVKSSGDPRQFFFADHPVPPGYAVPLHVHEEEDEAFYLLEGELTLFTPEGEHKAGPGAYIHLPRGAAHGFANTSGAPARMLVVASAGGKLEGLFRDFDAAARLAPGSAPEPAKVAALCAAHGIQMAPTA